MSYFLSGLSNKEKVRYLMQELGDCLRCDYDGFTWPPEVLDFITACHQAIGPDYGLDPRELHRLTEVRSLTVSFGRFVYERDDIGWPVDIRSFLYALAQVLSIYPGEFGGDAVSFHYLRFNAYVHDLAAGLDTLNADVSALKADVTALKAAAAPGSVTSSPPRN